MLSEASDASTSASFRRKLGKQGFALRHKHEFGAANSFTALDKCEFGAANSLPATDKYEFGTANSFPATKSQGFALLTSFAKQNSQMFGAQNSLPATDKYEFGTTNSLPAFKSQGLRPANEFLFARETRIFVRVANKNHKNSRMFGAQYSFTAFTQGFALRQKYITGAYL